MIFQLLIGERQVIAIAPGGIKNTADESATSHCSVRGGTTCIIKRPTKALSTKAFRLHQGTGHRQMETCHPFGAAGHIV